MTRPIVTMSFWVGGPPFAALLLLALTGLIGAPVAIICLIGCIGWSIGVASILARHFRRIDAAGRIISGPPPHPTDTRGGASVQGLLDRLPDGLFELGGPPGGRRVLWRNPAAISAYGTEESALFRHPSLRAALADAELADQPVRATVALATPMPRDLDAIVIRTDAPDRSSILYVLLADRTRERGIDRMRADFVANASHELRTPLTSLIGFIETLRGPALGDTEALSRFLAIMAEQAERMQRIIADLLSLSRIEMTEHQLPTETVDIGPLLRQVAAFMEPILRTGRIAIALDIPAELPTLRGDAGQLTQVFGNLIDNAVKYSALKHASGGGTITLEVAATPAPDFPQAGVLISVADDGPGIAREHLPRLTERFYRADKGRSRVIGGTGLGLAIVKHVVSRHRGRLVVESTEGIGTTCRVWLPLAPDLSRGLQTEQMPVARKG